MCVYLRTKFQISSIILTHFGEGGTGGGMEVILPLLSPPPQNEPLKDPHILGLKITFFL